MGLEKGLEHSSDEDWLELEKSRLRGILIILYNHLKEVAARWGISLPSQVKSNSTRGNGLKLLQHRLGTRFSGGLGTAGLTVGLSDVQGIFQPKQLYDFQEKL